MSGKPDMPVTRSECLAVLGLDESASPEAIRRAFRRLVLELHPDRNGGSESCRAAFVRVVNAYRRLKTLESVSRIPEPPAIPPHEIGYARAPSSFVKRGIPTWACVAISCALSVPCGVPVFSVAKNEGNLGGLVCLLAWETLVVLLVFRFRRDWEGHARQSMRDKRSNG